MNLSLIFCLLVGVVVFLFGFSPSVFAVSVTISNAPSSITEEPFIVNAEISGAQANTTNYLRVNFYKAGTTNYFGYTHNGTDWYNESTYANYLPISIDAGGYWSGTVQGKIDMASSYYQGSGDYNLKVRRYTAAGSYMWSNEIAIVVATATPTPTTAPAPTKTPTPTPTPKSSLSGGSAATATLKPTSPPTSAPTKILAFSSQAAGGSGNINTTISPTATSSPTPIKSGPTKKPTPTPIKSGQTAILGVAQSNLSKLLIGLGIIFLAACGIIAFRSFKNRKEDKLTL